MTLTHERAVHRFLRSETTAPMLLAVIVGLGAGVGAVAFRWLIATAQRIFSGAADTWLQGLGDFETAPLPAVGGLLVGLLVYFLAREVKGPGVSEVMLSVAKQGGRIRARIAVLKPLAAALCIGSGGSAGREGPIVQIGSALGSTLGQVLRLSEERIRLLVACGAAAGIAATFNAPIGGALFAVEVILRDFGVRSFGMVVLSSVAATAFSRATLGDAPAFRLPWRQPETWMELPAYVVLGLASALVGLVFVRCLYWTEDVFGRMRLPEYVKPVIGGALVGLLGSRIPEILGVGYETIERVLANRVDWVVCAGLVGTKTIATSLTIGSGGSGGVFAPLLFIGSVFGSAFGQMLHRLVPGLVSNPEGYAVVGMGSVFAGAAHAPVSTVIILFELTADYRIIVPLMAALVVSSLLSERLSKHNVYTLKLHRRGIDIHAADARDPMARVLVRDVMTEEVDTVSAKMSLEALVREFQRTGHHGFPVLDDEAGLAGIITLSDLERAVPRGLHDRFVEDIMTRKVIVCYADQSLREALADPAAGEVGRLPVVDPDDPRKLVGCLRRMDIVHAYTTGAAGIPPTEEFDHSSHEMPGAPRG